MIFVALVISSLLTLGVDYALVPLYLTAAAAVAGGTVGFLKWRTDTDDQEEKRKNEATRQAFDAYKETIGQLEKRVDAAESSAQSANERANLADKRLHELEQSNALCERRNIELTAMLELMRTILNDRGIHIPSLAEPPPASF